MGNFDAANPQISALCQLMKVDSKTNSVRHYRRY
jgi:hypothetical protein